MMITKIIITIFILMLPGFIDGLFYIIDGSVVFYDELLKILIFYFIFSLTLSGLFKLILNIKKNNKIKFLTISIIVVSLNFWFLLYLYLRTHYRLFIISHNILLLIIFIAAFLISIKIFCLILQNKKKPTKFFIIILLLLFYILILYLPYNQICQFVKIPEFTSEKNDSFNIILIVLDAVRSKQLSVYGYKKNTTPYLNKFKKDSIFFTNCISTSSWTSPGHASILTGEYLKKHGCHYLNYNDSRTLINKTVYPLTDYVETLPEYFKKNNFFTFAVLSNFGFLSEIFNLNQGFDWYYCRERLGPIYYIPLYKRILRYNNNYIMKLERGQHYNDAEQIVNILIKNHQKNNNGNFFELVNFYDAHSPYFPPQDYYKKFTPFGKMFDFDITKLYLDKPYPKEKINYLISQYNGEINYIDNQLERYFDFLKNNKLYDNSLIVITSDHGEIFGKDKLVQHGNGINNELLEVPLIIKLPGNKIRGVIKKQISNRQIYNIIKDYYNNKTFDISKYLEPYCVSEFYLNDRLFEIGEKFKTVQRAFISNEKKYIFYDDKLVKVFLNDKPETDKNNILSSISHKESKEITEYFENWKKNNKTLTFQYNKKTNATQKKSLNKNLKALGYLK